MNSEKIPNLIYLLTIVELSFALGMYVIQPIFPLHVTDLGASKFEIGLLMTLTSVVSLFARIPISLLSDRVGRWPIISFVLFSSFTSISLLALAPSYIWIYPIQAFRAGVSSSYMPTSHAIASDLAPPRRRAETLGLFLTSVGLASMIGPALCGFIVQYLNYRQTFLVAASLPLLGLISFILGRFFFRNNIELKQRDNKKPIKRLSFFDMFKLKNMTNLCFYEFAFQFAEAAFATLFSVYAKEKLLLSASLISILFSVRGFTNTVIRIPTGKISDKIGRRKPFYFAASLLAFTYLSLSVVRSLFLLCIVMIIYGIGFGIYKVMSNTLFIENVPPENRAVSLSIRFTAMGIGRAVGSFFAGASAMALPTTFIFGICSLVIISGLFAFMRTRIT